MQKFLWFVVLCGVGAVFFMVPLALGGLEFMLHFGITYVCRIEEGGMKWPNWVKIPNPVYLRVRLFNITNHKDFQTTGAKPKLMEVGPYVYRESIEKVDITIDGFADAVRYRQIRNYYFEPKMSRGKETDLIHMINVAFVGFAKQANELTDVADLLESWDGMLMKKGEKLTRVQTVKEILFEGFQVKYFLEVAKDPTLQSAGNFTMPDKFMDAKFGMLEGRNGTDEGWIEVRSGARETLDYGRVFSWNGAQTFKTWQGPPCNTIRGTDGMVFPPYLTPKSKLAYFFPSMCRVLDFDYEKIFDHNGINTYRYITPQKLYQTPAKNKENACYCQSEDVTSCPPQGIFSLANCFDAAPFVMSLPHFLYAERSVQKLEGISPDPEKHLGFFDLHPMTGLSIETRQRFQYNIELQPYSAMPTFTNVPKMYLPIMWIDEGGDLDDLNKTLLKVLDFGLKLWGFGKWVAIVFWILVTAGAIALIMYNRKNARVELVEEQDDDDD